MIVACGGSGGGDPGPTPPVDSGSGDSTLPVDSTPSDSGVDSATDSAIDSTLDSGLDSAIDSAIDSGVDSAEVDPCVARCPSGLCNPDGSCAECKLSSDCASSVPHCDLTTHRCVACLVPADCTTPGQTCCSNACTDVTKDEKNCGACGVACTASEFCTKTACKTMVLSNLCANPTASVISDGLSGDDATGVSLGNAFRACTPAPTVRTVSQDAAGILDPTSGKPLLGPGDTFVAPGGPFGQKGIKYIEKGISPVFFKDDGTNASWVNRATGATLVSWPDTTDMHHDFFVVELSKDSTTGTLVFEMFASWGWGTVAGGWWVQNKVFTALSTFGKQWYVVEWTDKNADTLPDAGDDFAITASGP